VQEPNFRPLDANQGSSGSGRLEPAGEPPPIALSEAQMCALLAASHPLPPAARPAFLEACAKEIANLPELGDGVLHRTIVRVQRMYFAPPNVDGRMRRASASGSGESGFG
jgi:hypothetical protein